MFTSEDILTVFFISVALVVIIIGGMTLVKKFSK